MSFEVGLMRAEARGAAVGACGTIVNSAVAPHMADPWIDLGEKDERDGVVGEVGYESSCKRRFCWDELPRSLGEIDADLDVLSGELVALRREVRP